MNSQQHRKLLFPLRTAVRGWAFGPDGWLEAKIAHGEAIAKLLPPALHADAEAILQPLRDASASVKANIG